MIIGEAQARVVQERVSKITLTADPRKPPTQRAAQACKIRRAQVREVTGFHIAPDLLYRVEVGCVRGQPLHGEPRALTVQVAEHTAALVGAQSIPDQDDAATPEMPFERANERDEHRVGVTAGVRLKEEATAPAVPAKGQCARDGESVPMTAGVGQDRRFAARGPGAADDRLLGDATFVFEDEPRVLTRGVFFRRGHRCFVHAMIAPSSRSRARRAGRWSDQPKPRSSRHT